VQSGSWDAHAHVIEAPDRYPLAPGRGYEPPLATLAMYLDTLDGLGIAHGLLVQPSVYGFDNRCMLDALVRADGRLLGVAVPAPEASIRDLETMHQKGVRGIRCNFLNPGGLSIEAALRWQEFLREHGWHIALHIAVEAVEDLAGYIAQFGVPVVLDHMGRPVPGRADPVRPALRSLIALVRDGACFVKLSAPYRLSELGPPWSDVAPLARALLAANPARCLWATDWPHPDTRPADSVAFDTRDVRVALEDWCPDPHTRATVLLEAPRTLLGLT
jgi:2-pyrone-4,6-dicarboxylate lactonase